MANGVNKVILVGNLGKDPEVKHLEGGVVVAKFPLATSEPYKDKAGNRVDQTEWHNIVLWRAQAEFAEKYLKKGYTIYVEGKLRTRSWEDANKIKKYSTEIVGESISILNNNEKRDDSAASQNNTIQTPTGEDLPF
jgi:single-strand DNA-binding protein